jgi:hypothetical protein
MAQIDFSICDFEIDALVEFIFSTGSTLAYNLDYDNPHEKTAKTLNEFIGINIRKGLFFIRNNTFSREPLSFRGIEKNGKRIFFIEQKVGGPTLELFLTQEYCEDGVEFIASSFLSHYPYYISSFDETIYIEVSSQQRLLFKEITNFIKKRSKKIKSKKRTYFLSQAVIQKIKSGAKLNFTDVAIINSHQD